MKYIDGKDVYNM